MTTFSDGPAKGQHLNLKRTPIYLRVVEENGTWDALNEVEDEPKPSETVHVYLMSKHLGTCHINAGRGRGGFYNIVEYRHLDVQVPQQILRNGDQWTKWVNEYNKANPAPEPSKS